MAWEAATARKDRRKQEDAEQVVGGLPKQMLRSKHVELAKAYAIATKKRREPDELPAPCYIEARLDQMEDGEPVAEPLHEVLSKAEAPKDSWVGPVVMLNG